MAKYFKKYIKLLFVDVALDYIKSKSLTFIPIASIGFMGAEMLGKLNSCYHNSIYCITSNWVDILFVIGFLLMWLYIFILNKDTIKQKLNPPEDIDNFKVLLGYVRRFFDIYNFNKNQIEECFNDKTYIYYRSVKNLLGLFQNNSYNKISDAYNNINILINKYSSKNDEEVRKIMLNFISLFEVKKTNNNQDIIVISFGKKNYQNNINVMNDCIKKLNRKL